MMVWGEARFTALGGGSRLGKLPLPFPGRWNSELPGTVGGFVRVCYPHKAAMASVQSARFPLAVPTGICHKRSHHPMSTPPPPTPPTPPALPPWATEVIDLYESGACAQFILHGNVEDLVLLPVSGGAPRLVALDGFLRERLLARFDVVISYDVGNGIRVDTAQYSEGVIPPYYDSMIAKLITYGLDRDEAIARMERALSQFVVQGVETTISLHQAIFQDPDFRAGNFDTGFMERFLAKPVS